MPEVSLEIEKKKILRLTFFRLSFECKHEPIHWRRACLVTAEDLSKFLQI